MYLEEELCHLWCHVIMSVGLLTKIPQQLRSDFSWSELAQPQGDNNPAVLLQVQACTTGKLLKQLLMQLKQWDLTSVTGNSHESGSMQLRPLH